MFNANVGTSFSKGVCRSHRTANAVKYKRQSITLWALTVERISLVALRDSIKRNRKQSCGWIVGNYDCELVSNVIITIIDNRIQKHLFIRTRIQFYNTKNQLGNSGELWSSPRCYWAE